MTASSLTLPEGTSAGERVRVARVAARRSLKDAARVLGVSVRTYSRIEDGSRPLLFNEAVALAEMYGQDLAYFGTSLESRGADGVPSVPLLPGAVKAEPEPAS